MEQLDNAVKAMQNRILIATYMDIKLGTEFGCGRIRGYEDAIEIINKEFNTRYESSGLEAVAQKMETLGEGLLREPLIKR